MKLIKYILKDDDTLLEYSKNDIAVRNKNGELVYTQEPNGYWEKFQYDKCVKNKEYTVYSNAILPRFQYDLSDNVIWFENSSGDWYKRCYNDTDKPDDDYIENKYWYKIKYDIHDKEIYREIRDIYNIKRSNLLINYK